MAIFISVTVCSLIQSEAMFEILTCQKAFSPKKPTNTVFTKIFDVAEKAPILDIVQIMGNAILNLLDGFSRAAPAADLGRGR